MSKWMAKRAMGAQVIEQPQTTTEKWLVETVRRRPRRPASACRRWRSLTRRR